MNHVQPTPDLFIGIDGGATKTLVRVENARGELLGQTQSGAANIRLSVEGSWSSIRAALDAALAQAGLRAADHRLHCGAGLAGTEVPAACERFLAVPHPFAQLLLKSDAYTSCLGAHAGADGTVIAIGTGVVGYRIEGDDEQRVGGWGFPVGDEGSGAWLGLEAARLALQWLNGRQPPSPLLEALYARFDRDLDRLVSWANQASATEFAQLAPLVVEHVAAGTELAIDLARRAAAEIDRLHAALAARSRDPALPCSLLGSLAPFLEPWLDARLRARLVPRRCDAVRGALLMIRRAVEAESRPREVRT